MTESSLLEEGMPTTTGHSNRHAKLRTFLAGARKVFLIFLISRLFVLAGIYLADNKMMLDAAEWLFRFGLFSPPLIGPVQPGSIDYENPPVRTIEHVVQYWDAHWYLFIAENGYKEYWNTGFYPMVPMMLRLMGSVLSVFGLPLWPSMVWSGLVLNHLFFYTALFLFYKLVNRYSGPHVATTAAIYLAFFPGAFFYSSIMTESPYLALSLLFFILMEKGYFGLAACSTLVTSLVRVNSITLLIPFLQKIGFKRLFHWRPLLWIVVLLVGFGLYPLFLHWYAGNAWQYLEIFSHAHGQMPPPIRFIFFGSVFLASCLVAGVWHWLKKHKPHLAPGVLSVFQKVVLGLTITYFGLSFFAFSDVLVHIGVRLPALLDLAIRVSYLENLNPLLQYGYLHGVFPTVLVIVFVPLLMHRIPPIYRTYALLNFITLVCSAGGFGSNGRYIATQFPIFWCLAEASKDSFKLRAFLYLYFGVGLFSESIILAALRCFF